MKRASLNTCGYAPLLGLAFYWAWVTAVFYSNAVFFRADNANTLVESVWLWTTWAHALALIAHVILSSRLKSLLSYSALPWISSGGMTVGILLLAIIPACFGADSPRLFASLLASSMLIGVCSTWHILLWGEIYSDIQTDLVVPASLLSIAIGLLAYFLFTILPPLITLATIALLPFCSLASIKKSCKFKEDNSRNQSEKPLSPKEQHGLPHRKDHMTLVVATFTFALCGEMLRAFSIQITNVDIGQTGTLYLLGGLIGLALLLAYFATPRKEGSYRGISLPLIRAILVSMAAVFLVAPFISSYSFAICYGLFGAGFWCFRAVSWVFCILLIKRFRYNAIGVVGTLDSAFALAVVVSCQLNSWLADSIRMGAVGITTISLITVFILMFIAMVVLNGNAFNFVSSQTATDEEASRNSTPIDDGESLSCCIRHIAQHYGLSPRETEVATLMAKGRSLPFIQNELFISQSTAQTHSRHIYKKMGIHSRQEFLDVVEQYGNRQAKQ